MYDSTTYNSLMEQRKFINRKNYELDSRSFAIKDYGYQKKFAADLQKKRDIESINFNATNLAIKDNFVTKTKNYTPITKFQKSMIDCQMGKTQTGPKINHLRPFLNMS